jgi:hypothetical protein
VYRFKGRYFVYYDSSDSYPHGYPSDLGLKVLHKIPHDVSKEEFEEWVRLTGEHLDALAKGLTMNAHDGDPVLTDKQPVLDGFIDIDWIYEIDLDNLVFHIDSQPIFHLDNMPPDKVFLKAISFDHFGHRAYHKYTPIQFCYDWHAPPPPPPPPPPLDSLIAYNSCPNRSSTSSIYELLDIPMALSSLERARTALVGLLVTQCMATISVGHYIRVLESVPDHDHISQSMLKLALLLVKFAVGPPIPSLLFIPNETWDFIWIREDVCLHITTHLDDKDNLHASIGDLVPLVQHRTKRAPFMALHFLSSTVPLFNLTKTSGVHQSPIRRYYNSCPPSMRGRSPRLE